MVFFEVTKLEGDLKIKDELSESKRIEFEKAKRLKIRQKIKAQKIKEEKARLIREEEWEKENKAWLRQKAREDKAEKKKQEELLLKAKQDREKRIEVLRIEEQRIINTSSFILCNDPYMDYSNDELLTLNKRRMLESIKAQIEWELRDLKNQEFNSENKPIYDENGILINYQEQGHPRTTHFQRLMQAI